MEFSVLLDAPDQPVNRVQIAKLGDDFEHGKYGQFAITRDDVATWKTNLAQLPGSRALIDLDHQADRTPRNTEAAGWITGVDLDGDTPVAEVEWTPKGKQAIEDKRYLFISPTYGEFKDEHGNVHENTLIGAALTNRPFLNMPAITLASDDRVSEALEADPAARFYTRALDGHLGAETQALVTLDVSQAERDTANAAGNSLADGSYPINNTKQLHSAAVLAASKHGDWQAAQKLIRRRAKQLGVDITTLPGMGNSTSLDSRGAMDKDTLLKTLDLPEDTSDDKLLEAITGLHTKAVAHDKLAKKLDKKPLKTLEQQAQDAGLVLLSAGDVQQMQANALAGAEAQKELHQKRFDDAFDLAVKARKAVPAERESLQRFYELDADAAVKSLDARQPIVPEMPSSTPSIQLDLDNDEPHDPNQVAAGGLHPGSHELNRKIRKHMLDNNLPDTAYVKVLEQLQHGALVL